MATKTYCLYSAKKGYLVKKLWGNKPTDYNIYWFNNIHEFNEEKVKIFLDYEEVALSRRKLAKLGFIDGEPIPDVRVRISGTEENLPLPEE